MRITDFDEPNLVKTHKIGLILGSSQFALMPQLPQKMALGSKVVKGDSKIIISLRWSKSVIHSGDIIKLIKLMKKINLTTFAKELQNTTRFN